MTDAERMAAIRDRQRGRTYSEKSVEREDEFMLRQLDAAQAEIADLHQKMNDAEATCDSYASENQRFHDRFTAAEARVAGLRPALLLLLDQVDYTHGKCGMAELVGAVLPIGVIEICRAALAPFDNPSTPSTGSTRAHHEGAQDEGARDEASTNAQDEGSSFDKGSGEPPR